MKLTRVDVALEKFFSQIHVEKLPRENTSIIQALGRILAENIVAEVDVPGFDRSAVDGYALRAEGTYGASRSNPQVFEILGVVAVGSQPTLTLKKMEAAKIATGAMLPKGANSIVMIENTEKIDEARVAVYSAVTPGENVSKRGEDVQKGERILSVGHLLQPQDLGILAVLGYDKVGVVRRPKVAILSTGNELVEFGKTARLGKIIDSNRPILMAMVKELGGEPHDLGIARDDLEQITSRITLGVASSDIVLVSGGTSVGARDFVPEAINSVGKPGVIVHGMCIRPGRPTALAAVGGKPIVLLPGFPVATMISFNIFVQPILLKMLGTHPSLFAKTTVCAKLRRRIPSSLGNRTFARVIVKNTLTGYVAEPLRTGGSGIISSMIHANGLVIIPEEKEGFEEGEEVTVTLLRPIGESNTVSKDVL